MAHSDMYVKNIELARYAYKTANLACIKEESGLVIFGPIEHCQIVKNDAHNRLFFGVIGEKSLFSTSSFLYFVAFNTFLPSRFAF